MGALKKKNRTNESRSRELSNERINRVRRYF